MGRTITLDEVGGRDAADFLREVARARETLRVVLEDGDVVTIDPCAFASASGEATPPLTLKPLTKLQGTIPDGWKDAIYDFSESEL